MNRVVEPYLKLSEVINGFAPARIVQVAVRLGVFSKLTNEGKTTAQLATMLHVDTHALELLLNALTGMGFLRKEAERFFDSPISHTYLSEGGPRYMGHLIAHQARRWEEWGQLEAVLHSGKPLRQSEMYQSDPKELEDFIRGMHELAIARGDARYLSRAIPLKRCRKMLDLGGGPGTYASMFCRANRQLQATVFDLPGTLKITRKILREFDMTGRVSTMSGDYRTDKIKGGPYDVVLVSNILHAEDEPTNRALLSRIHEVMTPGGILIIKEHVMSADHTEPEHAAVFALQMLLDSHGRTYSFAEISSWLEEAGFQDMVEVPMEAPMSVSLVLSLKPGKRALAVLPKPAAKVQPQNAEAPAPADSSEAPAAMPAARLKTSPRPRTSVPAAAVKTTRSSSAKSKVKPTNSKGTARKPRTSSKTRNSKSPAAGKKASEAGK